MNSTLPPPTGPMITALIVDDERPARARIRQLLLAHRTVVVIGEAGSVDQAVAAIGEHRPDVIFLDIHMKPKSGFELLAELPHAGAPIHVIFVTAFDEYAAESAAEFFAVASECFFQDPHRLLRHDRELYGLLATAWRQDPRSRVPMQRR